MCHSQPMHIHRQALPWYGPASSYMSSKRCAQRAFPACQAEAPYQPSQKVMKKVVKLERLPGASTLLCSNSSPSKEHLSLIEIFWQMLGLVCYFGGATVPLHHSEATEKELQDVVTTMLQKGMQWRDLYGLCSHLKPANKVAFWHWVQAVHCLLEPASRCDYHGKGPQEVLQLEGYQLVWDVVKIFCEFQAEQQPQMDHQTMVENARHSWGGSGTLGGRPVLASGTAEAAAAARRAGEDMMGDADDEAEKVAAVLRLVEGAAAHYPIYRQLARRMLEWNIGDPEVARLEKLLRSDVRLQLDLGDVLFPKTKGDKRYGFDVLAPDALAFLAVAALTFGRHNIFVVSRTNAGNDTREDCWAYQQLMDIGWTSVLRIPEANIQFVKGYGGGPDGKGPWSKRFGITHVVDDHVDHLLSCRKYACDTIHRPDGVILFGTRSCGGRHEVRHVQHFQSLAVHMSLDAKVFRFARAKLGKSARIKDLPAFKRAFLQIQEYFAFGRSPRPREERADSICAPIVSISDEEEEEECPDERAKIPRPASKKMPKPRGGQSRFPKADGHPASLTSAPLRRADLPPRRPARLHRHVSCC